MKSHPLQTTADALPAEVDALKRLPAESAEQKMLKSGKLKTEMECATHPFSPGHGGAGGRAWTLPPPARSRFARLLRRMLLTRSQLARIKGEP